MEVNHPNDHVTHAVLGGGRSKSFGIAQNAAFVHTLSATLYTNQILAVAREMICNHWDSHIASKITDRAIEISLTENKLVIRDYGAGIPDEMIQEIYCVYGNSTKTHNGEETGGFGLGCKAPFAYVEHFEVVSCHNGTKTIYRATKSDPEQDDMPSLVPILQVPTSDTGVIETLTIKSYSDYNKFKNYFTNIAFGGGIKVTLNGNLLNTAEPLVDGQAWFMIPGRRLYTTLNAQPINVRYGSVIYPIPRHEYYADIYSHIEQFLKSVNHRFDGNDASCIVFQAIPNTITVTPSRESLSLNDRTVKAISLLLESFRKEIGVKLDVVKKDIFFKHLDLKKPDDKIHWWLSPFNSLEMASRLPLKNSINSIPEMVTELLRSNSGVPKHLQKEYFSARLDRIEKVLPHLRGTIKQLRDINTRWNYDDNTFRSSNAPLRTELMRMIQRMTQGVYSKILDHMKAAEHKKQPPVLNKINFTVRTRANWGSGRFTSVGKMETPASPAAVLPYFRKLVVISRSSDSVIDRVQNYYREFASEYGQWEGIFFYEVGKTKKEHQQVLDLFTQAGFMVLDYVNRQEWEPEPAKKVKDPNYVPQKRPEGMVLLSAMQTPKYPDVCKEEFFYDKEAPRSATNFTPAFHYRTQRLQYAMDRCTLDSFTMELTRKIVTTIGDLGVVAYTDPQKEKMKTMNIPELRPYLLGQVIDLCMADADVMFMASNDPGVIISDKKHSHLRHERFSDIEKVIISHMMSDGVIQTYRPGAQITPNAKLLLEVLSHLSRQGSLENAFKDFVSPNGHKVEDFVKLLAARDPKYVAQVVSLKDSPYLQYLDAAQIHTGMSASSNTATKAKIEQLLNFAITL